MCLILFSYNNHPRYRLVLASNRDEFYERPTDKLHWWGKNKAILGGLDTKSGGTWLGITQNGRFAAVTNFRAPSAIKNHGPSRGLLVSDFLETDCDPDDYLDSVRNSGATYSGFNILVGNLETLFYYSNMNRAIAPVEPGYHGLSNSYLNTPWPKVTKGVKAFADCIEARDAVPVETLFDIMTDATLPEDHFLPDTGVGLTWERILAPIFIDSDVYGTRTSAVLCVDYEGRGRFIERTYIKTGGGSFESDTVDLSF